MPRKADKSVSLMSSTSDPWADLAWDDLEAWSGSRSLERGRNYQRSGHVQKLGRSADGVLLAWVQGTHRYATTVELTSASGKAALKSRCSCPVGFDACKHAVAVVLDYLAALKEGRAVPEAGADDRRWGLVEDATEDAASPSSEEGDDEGDDAQPSPRVAQPARMSKAEKLRPYVEKMPPAELTALVLELADTYPRVRRDLTERNRLAHDTDADLVKRARKEVKRLTGEQVYYNRWSEEGNLPDYSGLQTLLETLLARGQADALLDLGKKLYEGGQEQIGTTDDEGETAEAISQCMNVVFRAVLASSRADVDKLLYTIDLTSAGEFDICDGARVVLEHAWPPEVWSRAADDFGRQLNQLPPPDLKDFSRNYRRDSLTFQLADCLGRAGREAEILPLYEREAPITGSYVRLVRELLAADRPEEARRWALEGIEKVGKQWPGIAKELTQQLRAVAAQQQDWPVVAAIRAEEFFEHPGVRGLEELQQAADKAGCGPQVRAAALHFLETGVRPVAATPTAGVSRTRPRRPAAKRTTAAPAHAGPPWPLPALDPALQPERRKSDSPADGPRPHFDVLLDLAMAEKRPDDVLRWFDKMDKPARPHAYSNWGYPTRDAEVADAVADTHPERALTIYRQIVAGYIDRTSPSAYDAALPYLRKIQALLQQLDRAAEWETYLAELRETHRRKRRLLDVLDRIDRRRIVGD